MRFDSLLKQFVKIKLGSYSEEYMTPNRLYEIELELDNILHRELRFENLFLDEQIEIFERFLSVNNIEFEFDGYGEEFYSVFDFYRAKVKDYLISSPDVIICNRHLAEDVVNKIKSLRI